MKHVILVTMAALVSLGLDACGSSTDAGGNNGGSATGSGGSIAANGGASGGAMGSGGVVGTGGVVGAGGVVGTGGRVGTGGQSGGGGTSAQPGVCPYTVASFSCEAACKNLHDLNARCQNDPSLPGEMQAMLGLYGEVEVICTSSCAVVAPSSQAQWSCLQGVPADAPCSAIAGCNATNCP